MTNTKKPYTLIEAGTRFCLVSASVLAAATVGILTGFGAPAPAADERPTVYSVRQAPVVPVPPGVWVDSGNAEEDVLGCLLGQGYRPVRGGSMLGSGGHLQVDPIDLAGCRAHPN